MNIDIICPLYNAEKVINNQFEQIKKQTIYNDVNKIRYVITKSKDNTLDIVKRIASKNNNVVFKEIETNDFSHSLTRENEAKESDADIIVFITQDVIIEREDWLYNLTKGIKNGECDASYSRQISKSKGIEKYTREKNYPEESKIVTKENLPEMGLRTFFFSDASSAIKSDTFKKLNYYDNKKLSISEDMYIAYKLIMNGYKIKYEAESVVIHSHDFKFKQLYKRYYDTGVFFKENSYLDQYGTNKTGGGMAKYVLKRILQEKDFCAFLKFWPDMVARFVGMKFGKISSGYEKIEKNIKENEKKYFFIIFVLTILGAGIYYYSNVFSSILYIALGFLLFDIFKTKFGFYTNMPGIYSFIWFSTIGLSTLRLHNKQTEWKIETWLCLLGAYYFFLLGYGLYKKIKNKKIKNKKIKNKKYIEKRRFTILFLIIATIPIVSLIIEIVLNKGMIPLFSKEMSSYQEFGIGLIHYFTVASCLTIPMAYIFLHFFKTNKKEKILILLLTAINLSIPVFIVSRQLLIVTIVMLAFMMCLFNKKAEKLILISILILLILSWFFVGAFRNQDSSYLKKALEIEENTKLSVPNMQIYMYISMNYDNFNLNVGEYNDFKYGINSVYPIFGLTRIKFIMPSDLFETNLERIVQVYNTYPIVMTPYMDGGIVGVYTYMLLIGIICSCSENSNKLNVCNSMIYVILKVCLTFSFFASWFSTQTWWFYIIFLYGICKIVLWDRELQGGNNNE